MQKSNLPYLIIPLLIVCFCLFFNSCRTDKCDKPECESINKIDPEFARFWDFGYGTYWVYNLKSDTLVLDTLSVEELFLKENGNCPPFNVSGPPCTEFASKKFLHSNLKYLSGKNEVYGDLFSINMDGATNFIMKGSNPRGKYYGINLLNFSLIPYPNAEMQLVDNNPITINNLVYNNIAHLQTTLDTSIHKSIYTNQWWSKDIGLIKFTTSDGLEWELKSYELKK